MTGELPAAQNIVIHTIVYIKTLNDMGCTKMSERMERRGLTNTATSPDELSSASSSKKNSNRR
jgi:hypothetical protein